MDKKAQKFNRRLIDSNVLTKEQVDYLFELGTKTFQAQWPPLEVDGYAGPYTRAVLDGVIGPSRPVPGPGYVPRGKGLYTMSLHKAGSPEALVDLCRECDFSFVCILSVWQERRLGIGPVKSGRANSREELVAYGDALRKAGIEVWVWGYPHPAAVEEFVTTLVADATWAGAVGVILDPEKPFKKQHIKANILVDRIQEEACIKRNLAVGVTSYAATWLHRDFPYDIFSRIGWGSPQVYDNKNKMPLTYGSRAVQAYKEFGWNNVVISAPAFNKTPDQLSGLLATYPETPALIFWDLNNLKLKKYRSLWKVIREFQV